MEMEAYTKDFPEKFTSRYNETYKNFEDWCHQSYVESISEGVMLAYVHH